MRCFITVAACLVLVACSSSGPEYYYCSVADVKDPGWVESDREKGFLVAKIGVRHTRKAERDIVRLSKLSLAENLYSDVHSYRQSYSDGERLAVNQLTNVATNVKLENLKTDFKKSGRCLVAWATVSKKDAEIALEKSHPINKEEHKAWQAIRESHSISDYREHLENYPQGLYTETAEARIEVLKKNNNTQAINNSKMSPPARMFWQLLNNVFY